MTLKKIGDFIGELFGKMVFGFLSVVIVAASNFVPVWTDSSEHALQTVGERTFYGFPFPMRIIARGGSSLDGILTCGILNLLFWIAIIAFLDLRFLKKKPITLKGFILNWLFIVGALILLVLILIGPVTWIYEFLK